jgi:hypothetical protein
LDLCVFWTFRHGFRRNDYCLLEIANRQQLQKPAAYCSKEEEVMKQGDAGFLAKYNNEFATLNKYGT